MPLLKRATEERKQEWRPVYEGVYRWVLGKPEVRESPQWKDKDGKPKLNVRFPLELTLDERTRMLEEHGEPPDGIMQSYRASYTCGLSLGYIDDKTGQYNTTKLVDFLAACLGSTNARKFREWISQGNGPTQSDDAELELQEITDWLNFWDNLEVYGSIRHEEDKQKPGVMWATFAGPMAVGSLPGQKDDDYQAHGRGKLRAIIAESEADRKPTEQEVIERATAAVNREQAREEQELAF